MTTQKSFKAGEKIIGEGTFGAETFRIHKGQVLICKETGEQDPFRLAELGEGEMFGEMYMFESAGFRTASVIAKTDVELEVIHRNEIEAALEQTPQTIKDILMSLNKRLEGTSQNYSVTTIKTIHSNKRLTQIVLALLAMVLAGQLYLMFR